MLATSAEPGFEAAINEQLGLNFIFTNPNKTTFTLHIQSANGTIVSSITGMSLLYSYAPFVEQLESFEPKKVQQFSAFVPDGQVHVADEGRKGMGVEVHRTISYEGSVVVDEMISSDFYAPMPKIELHPLKKDSQQISGNSNKGTVDSQDNQNSSDSQNSLESSVDNNPSQLKGEEEKEVQYDKGGNIIE